MTNSINQNLHKYNNYPQKDGSISYRAQNPSRPQVSIPEYYNVPESYQQQSAKEMIKDSMLYSMLLKPFIEHPIAVLLTWLGMGYGLDKYSEACGGKYETSLVKKAANLGDKIQESAFVQSKPVQTVLGWFGSAKRGGGKIVENSAILRGMRDTHSMPEWGFVKQQMFNQKQEIVQDFIKIADALKLDISGSAQLKDIGLDKAEKEFLKKEFNVSKISQISQEETAVNKILLRRLGLEQKQIDKILTQSKDPTGATKKAILDAMGLDAAKIKNIKEDMFGKYIPEVEKATEKVGGKVRIGGGHYGWMGPFTKPFERTIGCDEIHNKLYSLGKGAKTATGRFMSKLMQMTHGALTFRQGKLASLLFIAPLLVEVGVNTSKADKDQKVGTAVGGLFESTSWIITWPIAARLLHVFGGAQYAGMSKEQVEEYRNVLKEFNDRTKLTTKVDGVEVENKNAFKTFEEYKEAKKIAKEKLKKLRNVEGQNIFTRGVRKLTRFFMMDLETLNGSRCGNFFQNVRTRFPNWVRNTGGVPMRVGMFAALAVGVFDGTISKIIEKIFGKSYDSMKVDERKDEKKAQKQYLFDDLNERLYKAQMEKQNGAQNNNKKNVSMKASSAPFVQNFEHKNIDNYTYVPSSKNIIPHDKSEEKLDNYTYIPSQDNIIKEDINSANGIKRSYIPSQEAANIQKNFDNSGLDKALQKADRVEARALKILAGNFEGMN